MNLTKILLTILIIVNSSVGVTATALKKDQAAPYDGVLFNNTEANSIKVELIEKDIYKDLALSYEKSIKLYKDKDSLSEQQIRELLESNKKLSEALNEDDNRINNVVWFSLGVLATGLSIYAAKKIIN